MSRIKSGTVTRRRHNKILKLTKGFHGGRRRLFRTATEALQRAMNYAFRDRRQRKRDFRKLWNIRINAAAREHNISYSKFIHGLKLSGIDINRKILAHLALEEPETFSKLVQMAKEKVVVS
ncbi:MAG: 50S ribosomal protein L20 [Candidatus Schekmanbacteria bacterium RBG_13_48_7]|uniref:Large ribosomal subunit protein bL20 n=1 Tax=Candidatus Schekmanbacteria bacterium RBG_13_48_7 TaxID=1817878 RepID=A0A1F7RQC4_9BACT|nr:MAG: 50S ribosomal protein L20 [Candidatus Schekmanbacteria bacterium RBG_13_48_7]